MCNEPLMKLRMSTDKLALNRREGNEVCLIEFVQPLVFKTFKRLILKFFYLEAQTGFCMNSNSLSFSRPLRTLF